MRFGSKKNLACLTSLILLTVVVLSFAPNTMAQERLRIVVGDTTGAAGELNSAVTVFLTNPMDQISAFNIWLRFTQIGIAEFQTQLDTIEVISYWLCTEEIAEVCVDSQAVDFPDLEEWDFASYDTVEAFVGNFDTVGTRVSGWEYVVSRSIIEGVDGQDIRVSAIADRNTIPGYHAPMSPGGGVLFRLLADILPIPDEQTDRTVGVRVESDMRENFLFVEPDGSLIGWEPQVLPDTSFFMCTLPDPGGCLEYTKVHEYECPGLECDSIFVGTKTVYYLDENQVKTFDGSITVDSWICGDVNGSGDLTIGDISLMVDHLFINGAEIDPIEAGNTNCSTEQPVVLTIGDISVLVDRLFGSQNPMCCE